jgi:hypothetical protein
MKLRFAALLACGLCLAAAASGQQQPAFSPPPMIKGPVPRDLEPKDRLVRSQPIPAARIWPETGTALVDTRPRIRRDCAQSEDPGNGHTCCGDQRRRHSGRGQGRMCARSGAGCKCRLCGQALEIHSRDKRRQASASADRSVDQLSCVLTSLLAPDASALPAELSDLLHMRLR